MNSILVRLRALFSYVSVQSGALWKRYRALTPLKQTIIMVVGGALLVAGISFLHGLGKVAGTEDSVRTVSLASVGSLSGTSDGGSVIGSVRSMTEADILAESGGTVRSVRTVQGARVGAGTVIAELENAAQRASVLQAEGAYDAAVAARRAVSPTDASASVRNTYQSAYTAIDYAIQFQIDSFYGTPTPYGPRLLISAERYDASYFPTKRAALNAPMNTWRLHLTSVATTDPEALLTEASTVIDATASLLADLADAANRTDSGATATQIANLASARATVNLQAQAIAGAREAYRGKSVSSTASVDASIKQALGSLRGAQAQLEKTIIRAPIGGTVNFLPIRVGEYVTAYQHVATVAENGALEIVAYVSESEREQLSVGEKVMIEDSHEGVITRIAPALDPATRQIELHVAVAGDIGSLVNGQSVRVLLPGHTAKVENTGPLMLPLASVKLRADDRVVFTVGEDGRVLAHPVEIGQVRGDRIEIISGVDADLRIVTDARGLSEGEKVMVALTSASS